MNRNTVSILLALLATSSILVACRRRNPEPKEWDASAVARGRQLFADHCAICHGIRGDGQGIRSTTLDPRPPDFTNAEWQHMHPDESVTNSIRDGVHGTAMPSWRILSEQQIRDLTAFVKSRS